MDKYCHSLLCGADSLETNSPTLRKFYIVTDRESQLFWDVLNQAIFAMGLNSKLHLPLWLLYGLDYICNVIGFVTGIKLKLNPFNVRMLTIHRCFSLDNSRNHLKFEPLITFNEGWQRTIEWFQENWLPEYKAKQQ